MGRTIRCTACGAALQEPIGPCPYCGGVIELVVKLTGQIVNVEVGNLSAAAREPGEDGGERIRYSSPAGTRSDSTLVGARVRSVVGSPVDVGRRGESDVFARLLDVLGTADTIPEIEPGASDSDGEDRVIRHGSERITIQIVNGGPGREFWKNVAAGDSEIDADVREATTWVHDAATAKAARYPMQQKYSMLLAIDLRHFGPLVMPEFVSAYIEQYGSPDNLGFGAVWLVGPTKDLCLRVGKSRW